MYLVLVQTSLSTRRHLVSVKSVSALLRALVDVFMMHCVEAQVDVTCVVAHGRRVFQDAPDTLRDSSFVLEVSTRSGTRDPPR